MADGIVLSKQGVYFSYEAIDTMRRFLQGIRAEEHKEKATVGYAIAFNRDGEAMIGLCGGGEPDAFSIADEVDNFVFYWYAERKGLDAVRGKCIDAGSHRKSRLVDLPHEDFVLKDAN